ncbi:MAG: DsbA family oxidoreductase [Deltaproteobacteria bacterium]|nr:DsbA family oxidoreductase [Nannocystaceae bacterium]
MKTIEIELFEDIVCPWCYLGAHRLERVIAALPDPTRVTVVHRPFQLRPQTPATGLDIHAELEARYGNLEPLFARLVGEADKSGLALDPKRQRFTYPTLGAHTLLRLARPRGTQPALAMALFRAHFVDARNIGDPEVLAEIAADHGFEREEARALVTAPAELVLTRAQTETASRSGITGVPLFVIGGRTLNGAQPEAALRAAIDDALATA